MSWSADEGKTWTTPVAFGMRLNAPSLYTLRDGTLVCLHGCYTRGGLRLIFSTDGGHTTSDAKNMSRRLLRVRIRADHSGIDLLSLTDP